MTTFNELHAKIEDVLRANAKLLPLICPLLISRDAAGRIFLYAEETVQDSDSASEAVRQLSSALRRSLGAHARHGSGAIFYAERLSNVFDKRPVYPLHPFKDVSMTDRYIIAMDWNISTTQSTGTPRIAFHAMQSGLGRSTATAAVALSLSRAGRRAVVLDLNFDSPGLTSTLLPPATRPQFGAIDWMLEELVDNADAVFNDIIARVPVPSAGELIVLPAHGRAPGEYIAKFGRLVVDKHAPSFEHWHARLNRMVEAIDATYQPDIILMDLPTGVGELATGCLGHLGANRILMFGKDTDAYWTGYRALFECWDLYGVAPRMRERMQIVAAMVPGDGRRQDCLQAMRSKGYALFDRTLYAKTNPSDATEQPWTFELDDVHAPHQPWAVQRHPRFAEVDTLYDVLADISTNELREAFGPLIDGLDSLIKPVITA